MTDVESLSVRSKDVLTRWQGTLEDGTSLAEDTFDDLRLMHVPVYQLLDFVEEMVDRHQKALALLDEKEIILFDGVRERRDLHLPSLLVRYDRTFNASEAIATIEFGIPKSEDPYEDNTVLEMRLMQATVAEKPTTLVTAVQRFTDSDRSTVSKPYARSDGFEASLRERLPDRYKTFTEEGKQIDHIERKLLSGEKSIYKLGALIGFAFAIACGDQQFLMVPHNLQLSLQNNLAKGRVFTFPINYDDLAMSIGLDHNQDFGEWWGIMADEKGLRLPIEIYNGLTEGERMLFERAIYAFRIALHE